MATCCGTSRCSCIVTAGPGVTVDGNGSPGAPYVISSGSAVPTALGVTDSTTVDLTLAGDGSAGSPYDLTAAVILDPAPPGGGAQLLQVGPDGLFLECEQVRGCLVAGDGIGYDPATGEITATPAPTALAVTDSTTVDLTLSGDGSAGTPYNVTAAVILDPAPPGGGDQLLQAGPDGLFLECEQVRGCVSAGDGAAYDEATGVISARPSTDAGNSLAFGTDGGLLVPPGGGDATVVEAGDSTTVDNEVTGTGTVADPYVVTSTVILDPAPPQGGDNLLQAGADGLFLECADVRGCVSAGDGATYTEGTGEVEARLSTDAGNVVEFGADGGLYVPAPAPPVVGCGLTGDGTAGAPLVVDPAAGQEAWPWPCDVATESTLKCDPGTGQLWTPPDHYSAMDHIYVEHFLGGWLTPIGPTGGWAIIDPGASQQFNIPPNFLGNNCRTWAYEIHNSGTWDIEHTADAVFELGLVVQQDGGALQVRPLWGHLTAVGQAHRERGNGSANETFWGFLAGSGSSCIMWPAINVTAGQVTAIHSWVSDATIDTQTNTP